MINLAQLYKQYKTPILFSGGSVAKAFAQMIVGFVVAKFVTPKDFGLWNTLNLALTYSLFVQAGLINGLNRELPYLFGKGEDEEALQMAGTVQTFTLISSVIVLLLGAGYITFVEIKNPKLYYGIIGVTILIVLNYYQSYLFSTFRSKNSFLNLSKLQFVHAFTNLLTLILVFYYTYYGLILKAILVALVYVFLMHLARPIKVGLLWNKEAFYKLLKVGLPIFILSYVEAIAGTTDKMLLLKYTNLEQLGLYSFGFYALSSFSIFPSSIASYIYPKMTYDYGKTNDKLIMWRYVKKITIILLFLLLPIAIIGYFLCPILIQNFFPSYNESARIMQILLFAGAFNGCVIGVNALWSMKAWKYIIVYQLFLSLFLFLMPVITLNLFSNKLQGIAYGVLIAHFISFIFGILVTYIATNKTVSAVNN